VKEQSREMRMEREEGNRSGEYRKTKKEREKKREER